MAQLVGDIKILAFLPAFFLAKSLCRLFGSGSIDPENHWGIPIQMNVRIPNKVSLSCGHLLRLTGAIAVFALMACMGTELNASIICPDLPEFNLDDQQASAGSSGSAAPARSSRGPLDDPTPPDPLAQFALASGATSSSGSTSNSQSSSGWSSSLVDLRAMAAFCLSDLSMTGWVTGELRFTLPAPPGNDLLRPPQDA